MLRLLVILLMLANGLYWVWSEGWLRSQGFAPKLQTESQRVAQQIKPESVRLLTPDEFKEVQALVLADLEPKQCMRAGPFDTAQLGALDQALTGVLPTGGWQVESVTVTERWIVYMGKFANAEALEKKRAELAVLKLVPQPLGNPALEIGLSLGGFDSQAGATAALAQLTLRGIRTARVVQERAMGSETYVKFPALTEAMKARLNEMKPAFAGHALSACAP